MSRPSVPTPPHAHAHASRPVAKPAGKPDCADCAGIGVVHVKIPGELRTGRQPCQCTVGETYARVRDERLRRLQRDVP